MFLNICEQSNILSVILYLKYLINILQFIIPIALIIMCTIDLGKIMLNPEDKKQPKILKRMIAAVLIFFIPTILNLVLDAAGQQSYTATDCWTNANTTTIAVLRENEEQEKEEARKARQKENEEAKKLLYVLASRAKENLYLFSETGYRTKNGYAYTPTDELKSIDFNYD